MFRCSSLTLLLLLVASPVCIAAPQPFELTDLNPFTASVGLPVPSQSLPTKNHKVLFSVSEQLANYFSDSLTDREHTHVDGETGLTTIALAWSVRGQTAMTLRIPYYHMGSGRLDPLIYSWHEVFGLPQGGRQRVTNGQNSVRYQRNGTTLINQTDSVSGLGDLLVGLQEFMTIGSSRLTWSQQLKIPTGNATILTGNGGWNLSLGASLHTKNLWQPALTGWMGVSGSWIGDGDGPLAPLQKQWAVTVQLGLGYRLSSQFDIKVQLDSHTPLYNSETDELGDASSLLTLGGDFTIQPQWHLVLALAEDIKVQTSPDVTLLIKAVFVPQ